MYCNKCNNLLKDGEHICSKCGFDNDATIDLSSVVRKLSKQEEKKSKVVIVIMLIIILCMGIVIIYLLNGEDEEKKLPINTTSTTAADVNTSSIKTFKFNDISLEYSTELFEKKDNSLIFKTNENIHIDLSLIDATEYNDELNGNDTLPYILNEIDVQTFAGENFYSYIFMLNDNYYDITVSFIDDPTIYTENTQIEINKVLNTLKQI